MSDDLPDLLTTARGFLRPPPGMESVEGYAAAAAHAAVDAAETLRRVESLLETADILRDPEMMAKIDRGEADIAAGRTSTLAEVRERLADAPVPDAPATPQVGEVWEYPPDGEQLRIVAPVPDAVDPWYCAVVKKVANHPSTKRVVGSVVLQIIGGSWRRVSPAPAPLTEREVTAQMEGVEPASDTAINCYEAWLDIPHLWAESLVGHVDAQAVVRALIARVRAEQARAEADVNAAIMLGDERLARMEARAERAEAQVALMRPVVEAAVEYEETHPATEGHLSACRLVCPAIRAYREATRGE